MTARGPLAACSRGTTSIEFLIVLFPVILVFLGVVQLALLAGARLVVSHAASAAARAAAVVVDDSPSRYGGEARGHLGAAGDRRLRVLGPGSAGTGLGGALGSIAPHTRADAIRLAASVPVAALSPTFADAVGWFASPSTGSVERALLSPSLARAAFGVQAYDELSLAVTPTVDESRETVRVDVEYLFHCAVPLVDRLLCDTLGPPAELPPVPAKSLLGLLALSSERFFRLRASATWARQRLRHGGGGDV